MKEMVLTDVSVEHLQALAIGLLPKTNYDYAEAMRLAAQEWMALSDAISEGIPMGDGTLTFGGRHSSGTGHEWIVRFPKKE